MREAIAGVEQQLPGDVRLNAMYIHRRGVHDLRGVDVNAPVNGVRPDPAAGPTTEVESIAQILVRRPQRQPELGEAGEAHLRRARTTSSRDR